MARRLRDGKWGFPTDWLYYRRTSGAASGQIDGWEGPCLLRPGCDGHDPGRMEFCILSEFNKTNHRLRTFCFIITIILHCYLELNVPLLERVK